MTGVIYIVRHGATKLNNQTDLSVDRIRGWADVPLAEEGRKEAKSAGLKLKAKGVEAIVASSLSRARETAEIIGKIVGVKPTTSDGLRPWNLGEFTGKSTKEVLPEMADYVHNKPDEAVPKGELQCVQGTCIRRPRRRHRGQPGQGAGDRHAPSQRTAL